MRKLRDVFLYASRGRGPIGSPVEGAFVVHPFTQGIPIAPQSTVLT